MTLTEAIDKAQSRRQGERATRAVRNRAGLEELVVEIQSRIAEQITDHAAQSRLILDDRGREAVADRLFDRAALNVAHQINHGTRETRQAALHRLLDIHEADEVAEDALVSALLSMLGEHNVNAHQLRRLVKANRAAITDGADVALDEPAIPAHLIERQKAGRS